MCSICCPAHIGRYLTFGLMLDSWGISVLCQFLVNAPGIWRLLFFKIREYYPTSTMRWQHSQTGNCLIRGSYEGASLISRPDPQQIFPLGLCEVCSANVCNPEQLQGLNTKGNCKNSTGHIVTCEQSNKCSIYWLNLMCVWAGGFELLFTTVCV